MNKVFTRIAGLSVGLALAIGVGIAVGQKSAARVDAATITTLSWSRSNNADVYTSGMTFNYASNMGASAAYRQDGSANPAYLQLKSSSALSLPSDAQSITFKATVGGGSTRADLGDAPVMVCLIDSSGNAITESVETVTSAITVAAGSEFTVDYSSFKGSSSVYGVKIYHTKITGYNVRYYSFSLEYVTASATPTIELNKSSLNLGVGTSDTIEVSFADLTEDITVTQTPSNGGSVSCLATISKDEASPYSFAVEGISAGEVELSFASSGATAQTTTVTIVNTVEHKLVESLMNLTPGSKFIIVGVENTNSAVLSTTLTGGGSGHYNGGLVSLSNGSARTIYANEFTLEMAEADGFLIKDSSNKYVGLSAIDGTGKFTINADYSKINYPYWDCEIDETSHVARLTNETSDEGANKLVNYVSQYNRFSNYNVSQTATTYIYSSFLAPFLYIQEAAVEIPTGADYKTNVNAVNFGSEEISFTVTSGDSNVATGSVSEGKLTISPVAAGTTTLTVTASSTSFEASTIVSVKVNSASRVLDHITLSNPSDSLYKGQEFSYSGTITAVYDNSDEEVLEHSAVTFTGYDLTTTGNQTVTVSYTDKEVTKTATYDLTVSQWTGELTIGNYYVLTSEYSESEVNYKYAFAGIKSNVGAVAAYDETLRSENALLVEEGATYNSYAFKLSNGKYLSAANSNNLYGNSEEVNEASSWTVSVEAGDYSIYNVSFPTRRIRCNHNNGNPRFAAYTSAQKAVALVEVSVADIASHFTTNFMHPEISVDDKGTGECLGETGYYALAKAAFNVMPEESREFFVTSTMYSNYKARLAAWAAANGDEFSEANLLVANPASRVAFDTVSDNNTMIIVISIAATSALAFTMLLVFKKKKQK